MCGIAGIVNAEGITPAERQALQPMLDHLAHRGPDDAGQYLSPQIALGHRRLSIIDLETGRQPVANETGAVQAVVNGEIYNFLELREHLLPRGHVFRSTGDSECLVHLYEERGEDCVNALAGMFAFAVWDQPNRKLVLGRDRLGVKPLYYRFDGRRLIFASELKSILAVPGVSAELAPTALIDYLTYSFIPSPQTILKGINKLPPGCLLIYHDGGVTLREYWGLRHRGYTDDAPASIAENLWQRLAAATRSRLVADVPVGGFLSGGLDSSAVAAAMAESARDRIVTVTCGFAERRFDERLHARHVAEQLGSRHREGLVRPEAAEIVETFCWHFDEPFADASAVPTYYLSREARRHVTVALSGDGGDEVLAGYRRYRFDQYEESIRRLAPAGLRRLLGPLAAIYPRWPWLPRPLRAAATFRNLAADSATAHALSVATSAPGDVRELLHPDLAGSAADYDPLDQARALYHRCDAPDHLSKCQYVDIRLGLADGILTKVDRASMAHALEVRSPMLDHRFVEFAWSIPPRRRIRRTAGKYPLRLAVAARLGDRVAKRAKAGFEVPLDVWFTGPLRQLFGDRLLHPGAAVHDWVSLDAVHRLWNEHLSGRRRHGSTLWKLVMLDGWARRILHGCAVEAVSTRHKAERPAATLERLACIR